MNQPSSAAFGNAGLSAIPVRIAAALSSALISCMVFAIRTYRLILSPWVGYHCRFHPSCSHYAEEAIKNHGALRGVLLAARRLGKCHPWHEGGCDPVPPPRS